MATIQDAIKRLIYQFTSTGADQVAADMNKVGAAQAAVAASAQTTTTASLSLEKSFDSLERRFVTTVKAQQDFEKVQNTVNAAVAQNPALQERANVVLEAAAARFEAARGSADLLSKITDKARESMIGFAEEGGIAGAILGSFGPLGVVAAGALGLVESAFEYFNENASKFGEASISINKVAEASGLTSTQVRGLSEAAEKAGVSGEEITSSFERFTANLASARDGTGTLFTSLEKINPTLAVQIASTKSGAEAWDLLAKATSSATDATQRAQLAKAAFGRGGVQDVPVLVATDQAGGLDAYSEEVQKATGITDELTKHTAQLRAEIEANKKQAENVYASLYSDQILTRQAKFAKVQLDIAQTIAGYAKKAGGISVSDFLPSESQPGLTGLEVRAGVGSSSDQAVTSESSSSGSPSSSDSTSKIKEQADETQNLTAATTALAAAQANADKAQQSYDDESESLTATTKSLTDSRKNAGDALLLLSNLEKQQITALSGAATGEEIAKQKTDALTAAFDKGTISAETYERALHGDTNNQLAALQDQLAVVSARAGAEKIAAQNAAEYNAMLRAGKDPADALQISAAKLADTVAAAVTSAKEQTQSLKDRNDLASVGNGLSQIGALQAQQQLAGQQAYNQVMKDTGAELTAQLAGQKAYNDELTKTGDAAKALEAGNKAYTDDIKNGTAAQAATNKEYEVTRGYQQQIKTAQDAAAASALQWQQNMLGVGAATLQTASAAQSAADSFQRAANAAAEMAAGTKAAQNGDFGAGSTYGAAGGYAAGGNVAAGTQYTSGGAPSLGFIPGIGYVSISDYNDYLSGKTTFKASGKNADGFFDFTSSPNSTTSSPAVTALTDSIKTLTGSTNTLNSTMQDALSPYYTQDPRTSHIGFRSQGMADGGYIDVPGSPSATDNQTVTIPVASGERVSVDPMWSKRGGVNTGNSTSQTINISVPIMMGGNANKDDVGRTVYQAMQGAAKRIQAASR